MKIAISVRRETLDKCTGKGCLQTFFRRLDTFAPYVVVGYVQGTFGGRTRQVICLDKGGWLARRSG